jgi:hypothetical protein
LGLLVVFGLFVDFQMSKSVGMWSDHWLFKKDFASIAADSVAIFFRLLVSLEGIGINQSRPFISSRGDV